MFNAQKSYGALSWSFLIDSFTTVFLKLCLVLNQFMRIFAWFQCQINVVSDAKRFIHCKIEMKGWETLSSTLKTSKRQIISLSNWHAQNNLKSNFRNWTYHPERKTINKVKIRINLQFTYESFSCIFPQANFKRWKRENEQMYKYMIMYY